MVNDSVLSPDVLLLRRGYECLKALETTGENEVGTLLADLEIVLNELIPPARPLPGFSRARWSCPKCGGGLALLFEASFSTAIDIDGQSGALLWGSEHPDASFYQPPFSVEDADIVCLSCGGFLSLPEEVYIVMAEFDGPPAQTGGRSFPAELAFPYNPLTEAREADALYRAPEQEQGEAGPHEFRLSEPDRLALAQAQARERRRPSAKALVSALFAGRGTLEILVGAAGLLPRLASALASPLLEGEAVASLRLETLGRVEQLFPSAPALSAPFARLFSCGFCGGALRVLRYSQECTSVALDQETGRLIRGSATLTDHYLGRPSFYAYDAEVVCAACHGPQPFLRYDEELAELAFLCVSCEEQRPLSDLRSVRSTTLHPAAPVCLICEGTARS